MFIWKTGKNQDKPVWIKIQNAMQNPDYYSTMVIQRIITKPQSLCMLVRYKYTMDALNLSLYQRSNYKILQCCYRLLWLHAMNVTASGLLPKILCRWRLTGKTISFQDKKYITHWTVLNLELFREKWVIFFDCWVNNHTCLTTHTTN